MDSLLFWVLCPRPGDFCQTKSIFPSIHVTTHSHGCRADYVPRVVEILCMGTVRPCKLYGPFLSELYGSRI